jgi:DNA polymerase
MSKTAIVDCETRSVLDLRRVGAAKYARHPSTDVWCIVYAAGDGPVELWLPHEPVPPAIIEAAADPDYVLVSHNANFERMIWEHILAPRYDWPNVAVAKWRCTMAMALALALPPKLKKLAAVLGLKHRKADDKIMRQMASHADRAATKTRTALIGSTISNVGKCSTPIASKTSNASASFIGGCHR